MPERKKATRHCCFSQSELNRGRYSMRRVLYGLPGSGESSRLTDIGIPFKNSKDMCKITQGAQFNSRDLFSSIRDDGFSAD